jgi:hypothetical protein
MRLKHRMYLADICNALNLKEAVEIGTHHAIFADQFMSRFRGSIYLVDPWAEQHPEFPTFYPAINHVSISREDDMQTAITIMEKYGDRVHFMRTTSVEAASYRMDETADFVYIDGLHEFESVSQDIGLWYPKVRSGGIIAGHDYHPDLQDVVRAVDEFREKTGIELFFTEDQMPSWWGIKQ